MTENKIYINMLAPINVTSYGIACSYQLQEMIKHGLSVALFPIGPTQFSHPMFEIPFKIATENAKLFNKDGISFRHYHQFSMAERVGKIAVGYTVFELDQLTDTDIHHLNSLDIIICPTDWQANIIRQYIKDKQIIVCPLGVDTTIFKPVSIQKYNKPFIFFMNGKWEKRKNQVQIIEAFEKTFAPYDDVELHMMCHHYSVVQKIAEQDINTTISKCRLKNKIKIYPAQFISSEILARIYNQCDCFVSVSRAEGFNMCLLEAMACGKNVIASIVTGHTQYLQPDSGILIESSGEETANDGIFFKGFGNWHCFNLDDICDALKYAYSNFKDKVNTVNTNIATKFDWSKIGENLCQNLKSLII